MTSLQFVTLQILLVTFGTRLLSLLRDSLIAGQVGATQAADDFYLIVDWANFATTLIATTAINLFLPRLRRYIDQPGLQKKALLFYSTKYYCLILASLIAIGGGFWLLSGYTLPLVLGFALIFAGQGLAQYFGALLNVKSHFLVPTSLAILPILGTLSYFILPLSNPHWLLYLFAMGVLLQFLVMYFLTYWSFQIPHRPTHLSFPHLQAGMAQWAWLALATFYFPASNFLIIQLAAFLPEGSIATLSFSSRIPFAISNILIFSFWTVALPTTDILKGRAFLNTQIYHRLGKVGAVALGIGAGGFFFSEWLIWLIYGQGDSMQASELALVNSLHQWLMVILPVQVVTSLLMRYLHIMGEAKATLVAGFIGLALQVGVFLGFDPTVRGILTGFVLNFACVFIMLSLFSGLRFVQQRRALGA
jgi:peptidoglycan biosynthesis protein MviN/MurJ (putative lipid II flippase)